MNRVGEIKLFTLENNQLAYRQVGYGPATLIAFHGFGQTGHVFAGLEKLLGQQYTIIAIDLFFHGHSRYGHTQLLTKAAWQSLIGAFLHSQQIDRFSIIGFSLGGRFALTMIEAFATRVDQLILIAPDGITYNQWYWLATGSSVGRWLFRYMLTHLSLLNSLGHSLTRLGLLNRTVMRFVEISLGTPEQRDLVYQSWTQFRLIRPDLNQIGNLLNEKPIQVRFFTGAFDRLVPGRYIIPLTKLLRRYELTVLQTGHNHLIELAGQRLV
ncbi:alpha/beta hydrolase [Spirosoma aureum]|uniref:Alpha/beta hydrolase n=1 Tax=Spirosoma aureum TaxID=2692134 RepID=A0A6G9AH07_9BACT|nr:alpha/beta hydrolase [Spirosoma aureum]QIP11575.1 alpha/beta hydrolase [Spirosoma aureum]